MNETNSPHWEKKEQYSLHSGLSVASFINAQTQEAKYGWITAQGDIYIGELTALPPHLQQNFIIVFEGFFQRISQSLLSRQTDFKEFLSEPPYQILHQLPYDICLEILLSWCASSSQEARFLEAEYLSQFSYSHQNYNLLTLIKPFNIASIQEILRFRTLQKSSPSLLSPFPPGLIVKAQHHIRVKNLTCYRFQDPFQKEVFYLAWLHNNDPAKTAPLFYAPTQSLFIGSHQKDLHLLKAHLIAWILSFPEPKNFNAMPSEIDMNDYGIGQISDFWSNTASKNTPNNFNNHPFSWAHPSPPPHDGH